MNRPEMISIEQDTMELPALVHVAEGRSDGAFGLIAAQAAESFFGSLSFCSQHDSTSRSGQQHQRRLPILGEGQF
jgi:hypothetical protein